MVYQYQYNNWKPEFIRTWQHNLTWNQFLQIHLLNSK